MTQVNAGSRAVAAGVDPSTLAGGLPTLMPPFRHGATHADKDHSPLTPRRPTADGAPSFSAENLNYDGLSADAVQLLTQQCYQQQRLHPLVGANMVNPAWSSLMPAEDEDRGHAAWPQPDGDVYASDRAAAATHGGYSQQRTDSLLYRAALAAYGIRRLSTNSVLRGVLPRATRNWGNLRRLHSTRSAIEVGTPPCLPLRV